MGWFLFGSIFLCIVLIPVFLAERWCRRHKAKKYFPVPKGMGWLQMVAVWVLYHLPESVRESEWLTGYAGQAAGKLYPGIKKEKFCRKHAIEKIMIIYGCVLFSAFFLTLYHLSDRVPELINYTIQREDAKGESRDVAVEAEIEAVEGTQKITLNVSPRKYSKAEREALLQKVTDYIDQTLPGENTDLQHVETSLVFPDGFPGENVGIEWMPDDYNLIHQDGTLGELSDISLPAMTKVTAVIRYGEEILQQYEKDICIVSVKKTELEKLQDDLQAAIKEADKKSEEKLQLVLPKSVDGHAITWRYQIQSQMPLMILMCLIAVFCLLFYQEERLKEQLKHRTEQLLYDYPGFVYRMVLMLGAGMTTRRSWYQLMEDYEKDGESGKKEKWLYQELRYAHIQMQSVVPEIQAYIEFGKRTELHSYIKFMQLLTQYIRRGSKGMQELMLQEAEEAEKQRRDFAKQLGETAGTKLLLPMMLLLVIVLMIVMMPAFLSM